jgi:hypothetical protein
MSALSSTSADTMTTALLYTHEDRNTIKALAEADFLNVFKEHGGRWRGTGHRKSLLCPFHRDKNPSATFYKGQFHCFACGVSMDVIGFIERIRHTNFKGALAYLSDRYGVPLNNRVLDEQERRRFAQRRADAEREAKALLIWRDEILATLRQARNAYLQLYHRAIHLIIAYGLDHPMGDVWAVACETYELRYQALDQHIDAVAQASFAQLLPFFRSGRRRMRTP